MKKDMKKNLRMQYLNIRNNINPSERINKSNIIYKKLICTKYFLDAQSIFIYKSMGSEVITDSIINYALKLGKIVAVPHIITETKEMHFVQIFFDTEFVQNKFSILEPKHKLNVDCDKHTIIIVPALVFDQQYFRIGYGGGYYDKYLSKYTPLHKVGIGFKEQITDHIPIENFDVQLDNVIYD